MGRSAVDNDELDAVIVSWEFATELLRTFAFDEAKSEEISLEAWPERPWRERSKERRFHLGPIVVGGRGREFFGYGKRANFSRSRGAEAELGRARTVD